MSICDIKPIHFLSVITDTLEQTNKYHMFYCNVQKTIVRLEFLRVNINNECNLFMGGCKCFRSKVEPISFLTMAEEI